jgi:DNA-binding NarL/FixJ family response regulator
MTGCIFIVEDHPRMRETYRLFFKATSELEICGMVATAAEALMEIPLKDPDLVIVDISLPDTDGIELTRQLRQRHPSLPILIVSGHEASAFADAAAEAGANGFVNKQHTYSTLIPTIRQILDGR